MTPDAPEIEDGISRTGEKMRKVIRPVVVLSSGQAKRCSGSRINISTHFAATRFRNIVFRPFYKVLTSAFLGSANTTDRTRQNRRGAKEKLSAHTETEQKLCERKA